MKYMPRLVCGHGRDGLDGEYKAMQHFTESKAVQCIIAHDVWNVGSSEARGSRA